MDGPRNDRVCLALFLSKTFFLGKLEFGHYPHHDKKHTTGNGQMDWVSPME